MYVIMKRESVDLGLSYIQSPETRCSSSYFPSERVPQKDRQTCKHFWLSGYYNLHTRIRKQNRITK